MRGGIGIELSPQNPHFLQTPPEMGHPFAANFLRMRHLLGLNQLIELFSG